MPWYENESGVRLWHEEQGTGPALVLLHGWCMSSVVWRFQLEQLSGTFRVIAPDLRGHGRSERSGDGYSFEKFAADIAALFRHLDLRQTLLAGWSLGAQVALLATPLLRERLAGLALISGTPRFTATDDFPHALAEAEASGMGLKVRRNFARALEGFTRGMFAAGEMDDEALAGRIRALLATVPLPDPEMALASLQALATADMRFLLPAIDLPTLIISGDRDQICLPQASQYMAQRIKSSCHVIFQGCGHAPFLAHSLQFNAEICSFGRRIFEPRG